MMSLNPLHTEHAMAAISTIQKAFNTALKSHIAACARADAALAANPSDATRAAALWAHNRRHRVSARRSRDGARKARAARLG